MKPFKLLPLLATVACASGPALLTSPPRDPPGWITVSLTLQGDSVTSSSRNTCIEEARAVGVQLVAGSTRAGTLILEEGEKNYFEMAGTPRFTIEEANPKTVCRIALARLVELDKVVRFAKADPPASCEMLGRAEGTDTGWLGKGSFAAAVADAQFKVRAQGGNLYVQDVVREHADLPEAHMKFREETEVRVAGRAFRCPN